MKESEKNRIFLILCFWLGNYVAGILKKLRMVTEKTKTCSIAYSPHLGWVCPFSLLHTLGMGMAS